MMNKLDPEQCHKKEQYKLEQKSGGKASVGELVVTESGVMTEQFLFIGKIIGLYRMAKIFFIVMFKSIFLYF